MIDIVSSLHAVYFPLTTSQVPGFERAECNALANFYCYSGVGEETGPVIGYGEPATAYPATLAW